MELQANAVLLKKVLESEIFWELADMAGDMIFSRGRPPQGYCPPCPSAQNYYPQQTHSAQGYYPPPVYPQQEYYPRLEHNQELRSPYYEVEEILQRH